MIPALVPWCLMDVALNGVGLFTPTILRVLAIGGKRATGPEPWLEGHLFLSRAAGAPSLPDQQVGQRHPAT